MHRFVIANIGRLSHLLESSIPASIGRNLTWFCFVMSTWLVTLVSTERFLAICHPIKYRVLRGTNGVLTSIGILFVGSICFASLTIPFSFSYTEYCFSWPLTEKYTMYPLSAKLMEIKYFPEHLSSNYFLIADITFLTVFVIVFIANCYMYKKTITALQTRKRNKTLQTSAKFERSIRQASVMVIANGLVFFVCLSIFALMIVSQISEMVDMKLFDTYGRIIVENITLTVLLINASVNPYIYIATNQHVRHSFEKMIRNIVCKTINSDQRGNVSNTPVAVICDSHL